MEEPIQNESENIENPTEPIQPTKKPNDIDITKENIEIYPKLNESLNDPENDLRERFNSVSSELDSSLNSRKSKDQKLHNHWNITLNDICCLIFCCRSISRKKAIYNESESKFNYYIDIVTYMKKMQEIDIIKYLLLDINTLNLMNFISKPSVSLSQHFEHETKEHKKFFDISEDAVELTEENLKVLKKSYLNIISKPRLSLLEKRILELFDKQIKDILN